MYKKLGHERKSQNDVKAAVLWRLKLFDDADGNKDGKLNLLEFKTYYRLMEEALK